MEKPEKTVEEPVKSPEPTGIDSSMIGYWLCEDPEYETVNQLSINKDGTCSLDTLSGELDSSGNVELEEGTDSFWFDIGTYTVESQSADKIKILCTLKSNYDMPDGPPDEPYKLLFDFEKVSDNQLIGTVSG